MKNSFDQMTTTADLTIAIALYNGRAIEKLEFHFKWLNIIRWLNIYFKVWNITFISENYIFNCFSETTA